MAKTIDATIFDDHACELGEGPSYDPVSGTLFWFDIVGKALFEKQFLSGSTVRHDLPIMASAIAVIDKTRQLLVTEQGLMIRNATDGALSLHRPMPGAREGLRSNDSRTHPSGALWFSSMGKRAETGAGAIHRYFRGEVETLFPAVSIPNAICFSADGRTGFFADTKTNRMMRVDCDPASGKPVGQPQLFLDRGSEEAGIDGAVMDADGTIWIARWGSAAVEGYDGEGRMIDQIALPAGQISCPCFVGPDADRMVVTSAWQDLDEGQRAADPQAGQTFLLQRRFRGRFDPPVAL